MSPTTFDPFMPALAIAAAVRERSLSALEVTEASLDRIERLDAEYGAFSTPLPESALAEARAVDLRVASGDPLSLAGVPVAVKDHIWVAGAPATNGSRLLADHVPTEDCAAVRRLREAGAVIIGKTNNPEFCYRGDTVSPLYGTTRNPYAPERTPGGSSGGSAVAVATGMTPLALGTDAAGSIRCPATFCGIVGYKPTHGLVPTRPGFRGWPTLSVHGPMGRNVADVAAALSVLAGPDGSDLSSIPAAGPPFGLPLDGLDYLSGLRVAFSWDLGFARVADEVRDGFGEALSTIGALGVRLHEAHPTVSEDVVALWLSIGDPERHASEGPLLSRAEEMTERSVRALRRGEGTSARDYLDAQHRREEFSREWEDFLTEFDVLVYPGEPILPFALDESDRIHAETTFWEMDMVANLTKQPAVSLPCGMSNGLPVGLQVLARRHGDAKLLRAAAAIERHLSAPSLRDSWS